GDVGVAHTGGGHPDEHLPRPGLRPVQLLDRDLADLSYDCGFHRSPCHTATDLLTDMGTRSQPSTWKPRARRSPASSISKRGHSSRIASMASWPSSRARWMPRQK